jgi:hypothetical protein
MCCSPWNFGGGPGRDRAASSLAAVTAVMVASSAACRAGRCRCPLTRTAAASVLRRRSPQGSAGWCQTPLAQAGGSVALARTAARERDSGHENPSLLPCSGRRSTFAGFRFPRDVIVLAVGWYVRVGLSYRDVEELLAGRGVAESAAPRNPGQTAAPTRHLSRASFRGIPRCGRPARSFRAWERRRALTDAYGGGGPTISKPYLA